MRTLRLTPRTAALLIAACVAVAYLNSLGGRFVMDDQCEIVDNPVIRTLVPPWRAMFVGRLLPARPLPYLTFAIDYACWGPRPLGYHITNLVIHTIAALALLAFARLTLAAPRFHGTVGDHALPLALCITVLWAVHPLNTQAVTYVYQRIESMTGMFCLVSLAAFAQAAASGWDRRWLAGCVLAAAAAMASKENAVVLPLLILSYDWLVVAEPGGLRRRRWFYAALFATWAVLAACLIVQASSYQEFQGISHPPLAYALTQPRVILHYLRLALWPTGQCFDMPWKISETWREIIPSLLYMLAILAVIAGGVARRRSWSWLGVAFLLALAPTSSIMPVAAPAAEHRMYLPLAAVAAAVVLGCHALLRRRVPAGAGRALALRAAAVATAAAVVILVLLTQARNELYAIPGGIWLDVLQRQPNNGRALWNLAITCTELGDLETALPYADRAAGDDPRHPVYDDMTSNRLAAGDLAGAECVLRHAVLKQTELAGAAADVTLGSASNLATLLRKQRRFAEAEVVARAALAAARQPGGPAGDSFRRLEGDLTAILEEAGRAEAAAASDRLPPHQPTSDPRPSADSAPRPRDPRP